MNPPHRRCHDNIFRIPASDEPIPVAYRTLNQIPHSPGRICRLIHTTTLTPLSAHEAEVEWRHWTPVKTPPPCWRYASWAIGGLKCANLKIFIPRLFAHRVFRLVCNSTQQFAIGIRQLSTLHCCRRAHLQYGGSNYCRENDVTVTSYILSWSMSPFYRGCMVNVHE